MNQACKKKKAPSLIWSNFIDEVEIKDGFSEKINLINIGSVSLDTVKLFWGGFVLLTAVHLRDNESKTVAGGRGSLILWFPYL